MIRNQTNKDNEDKSGLYGKIIVAICISFLLIFSTAVFVNFVINGNEPTTLIPWVFAGFGGELGLCALKRVLCGKKAAADHEPKNQPSINNNTEFYDYETEEGDG